MSEQLVRCPWPGKDPLYLAYHDNEWGRPVFDDRELFEKLCLDGQQAGLSWITILRKQQSYRRAYAHFDPEKIATFGDPDIQRLMQNPGIVRNRQKVHSIINNARAFLDYQSQPGRFSELLWSFVDGCQIDNKVTEMAQIPARSMESEKMSRELKRLGFSFVGPTICYAFMQAVGMVNDHLVSCFCHGSCRQR
jgi:DNA-3-methyladenine glycosylase I